MNDVRKLICKAMIAITLGIFAGNIVQYDGKVEAALTDQQYNSLVTIIKSENSNVARAQLYALLAPWQRDVCIGLCWKMKGLDSIMGKEVGILLSILSLARNQSDFDQTTGTLTLRLSVRDIHSVTRAYLSTRGTPWSTILSERGNQISTAILYNVRSGPNQ
ncbi:MAG: hypothetical protein LBB25_00325 [Holosporaceae bacterium]|nr:hypothetical protein [Holosporaceae bacterium]